MCSILLRTTTTRETVSPDFGFIDRLPKPDDVGRALFCVQDVVFTNGMLGSSPYGKTPAAVLRQSGECGNQVLRDTGIKARPKFRVRYEAMSIPRGVSWGLSMETDEGGGRFVTDNSHPIARLGKKTNLSRCHTVRHLRVRGQRTHYAF